MRIRMWVKDGESNWEWEELGKKFKNRMGMRVAREWDWLGISGRDREHLWAFEVSVSNSKSVILQTSIQTLFSGTKERKSEWENRYKKFASQRLGITNNHLATLSPLLRHCWRYVIKKNSTSYCERETETVKMRQRDEVMIANEWICDKTCDLLGIV